MVILGIGGILDDAACAAVRDGEVVAAVEEHKLHRAHHEGAFPEHSLDYCLKQAGVEAAGVGVIALARPIAASAEGRLHLALRHRFPNSDVVLVDHHEAHAASACCASGFDEATALTLDRSGDYRCGARWRVSGGSLTLDRELYYPDSLGHLYGRVTELLGFSARGDEHKTQWLSTFGDDRFVGLFSEILSGRDGDWPRVDRTFFDGDRMRHGAFSARFYRALGVDDGEPLPAALRPHVAAGLQRAVEQMVIRMAGSGGNLCLGGGLALNALLVAALERSGRWNAVHVQPAAGNAGTAIGAAASVCGGKLRMPDLFLGPSFEREEIKQVVENCKLRFRYLQTIDELVDGALRLLSDHKIVAWMQGRMEFGPRALGNRSILASPLDPYSTENLNAFIKHREPFRKFAASVPAELAAEYFDVGPNARFLATIGRVKPAHRKTFETAILGEDLVRVHTVAESENPAYWRLLHAAGKASGLPVLYNTSFNLFGDPLVCSPRDAVRSFYSSGIDAMLAGQFLLEK